MMREGEANASSTFSRIEEPIVKASSRVTHIIEQAVGKP